MAAWPGRATLLEVGCATGKLYRCPGGCRPGVEYYGVDILAAGDPVGPQRTPLGASTIDRTSEDDSCRVAGLGSKPDFLYAKDVVHHQTDPSVL